MKKLLLSILAVMFAFVNIQAEDATFDATDQGYENAQAISEVTIADAITVKFDKGTNSNGPKYYASGTAIRVYAKNSFTFEANNATITSIVITFGSEDGTNEITTDCGTYDNGTWTGSSDVVKFTVGGESGNRRIMAIAVTYTVNGGTPTVAAPTFDPGSCAFEGELDVEIKAAEGAAIHYTLDGTAPTAESPVLEGGVITVDETTTIKAFAALEGYNNSRIVEATYTKIVEKTIAEIVAAGVSAGVQTKGTVVATHAKGFLLSDATGTILVYLNGSHTHAVGDVVTVNGATSMYGGLLQFGSGITVEKTGTAEVTYPTAVVMDGAAMDAFVANPSVKYAEYTGKLVVNGSYYNIEIEGATTAQGSIQYPNDGFVTASNGDIVKVTGYVIGVSGSKYVNTMATSVVVVEEGEEPEIPTDTEEFTVAQALAAYVDGKQIPAIVTGYIVGAMNSTGYVPEFGTTTVASNILLSDNADETDLTKCIIVQLPSGKGNIRKALNLVDNPGNYKKQVKLTGSIEKYFQQAGLKNPTAYEFTGVTAIDEVDAEDGEQVIYDLTGRRVNEITNAGIYIVNGVKRVIK